jgi:DNA-binding response OmpR family regulator
MSRILIVDDEPEIVRGLEDNLRFEGYQTATAMDGREALVVAAREAPDLILLDIMMPGLSGWDVCRELRGKGIDVPIIMLTARGEEGDRIRGLELGADDYITKPFSLREFRSRVKAALRRAGMPRRDPSDEEPLVVHELRVDPAKRAVEVRGLPVQTTYVEFEILLALATSPGRVWTRDMLLTRIWGDSAYRDPRTIDVHIRHLREKLERDAKEPEYLFTVRGVGYRFRDTEG